MGSRGFMMWKLAIMALAAAAMAGSASAEGLARGALKDTMFPYICTISKTARQEVIVFVARPDSTVYTALPSGQTATRHGNVFTSVTADGTFSVNESSLVYVTDDDVMSGSCVAIGERLDEMIGMIEVTAPDAFDKLAANYIAPWSEDLARAKADEKAKAKAEIFKAKEASEIEGFKVKAAAAAEIAKAKTQAEAEITKAKVEAEMKVKNIEAEAEARILAASAIPTETYRLRRENDRLKTRICLMDPKATFSICPEVRATAKP